MKSNVTYVPVSCNSSAVMKWKIYIRKNTHHSGFVPTINRCLKLYTRVMCTRPSWRARKHRSLTAQDGDNSTIYEIQMMYIFSTVSVYIFIMKFQNIREFSICNQLVCKLFKNEHAYDCDKLILSSIKHKLVIAFYFFSQVLNFSYCIGNTGQWKVKFDNLFILHN